MASCCLVFDERYDNPTDLGNKEKMAAAKDFRSCWFCKDRQGRSQIKPTVYLPLKKSLIKLGNFQSLTNRKWLCWHPVVRVGRQVPFGYHKIQMIKILLYLFQKN